MSRATLSTESRIHALDSMSQDTALDVLVIGGGVTGAGIALDAATRGLRTGIVEAQDWASGTSSRSSKLVHGGLRYLLMLDFKLVHEALTERDLLLNVTAPHLVRPQPFLYPLKHRVWERPYVATGVGMYDALAHASGSKRALPIQKHLTKSELKKAFPSFRDDAAVGAVRYFDAQVDDARLVLTLVRTASAYGAYAANRTQVTKITKDETGRVTGADVRDLISGKEQHIKAKTVINATGVWTEQTEALADTDGGLKVLASKGVHLVVPKDKIQGKTGLILMTEKSVLFVIPWDRYWIIGTTDTPWEQELVHPVATAEDIEYILDHVNDVLDDPLTKDDVVGVYAGLRPLLQPGTKEGTSSAKVSREHTVASPVEGLIEIAGGKLTTYRVMAEDAVDFALGDDAKDRPSITSRIQLLGAEGFEVVMRQRQQIGRRYKWNAATMKHLLGRYGSLIWDITALVDEDPELGKPVPGSNEYYLKAEIIYAVRQEGANQLEDILLHRTRLSYEVADSGLEASEYIASVMANELGWDDAERTAQLKAYADRIAAERAAARTTDDVEAADVRDHAGDLLPMG